MKNPFNEKCELYEIFSKDCCDLNEHQVFIFDGKLIQCIAFLEGISRCKGLKRKIKTIGFFYQSHIECYVRYKDKEGNSTIGDIREEKDQILQDLIQWKLKHPIHNENEQ